MSVATPQLMLDQFQSLLPAVEGVEGIRLAIESCTRRGETDLAQLGAAIDRSRALEQSRIDTLTRGYTELVAAGMADDTRAAGRALLNLASAEQRRGHLSRARGFLDVALVAAAGSRARPLLVEALTTDAAVALAAGREPRAILHASRAHSLAEADGDHPAAVAAALVLGDAHALIGDWSRAAEVWRATIDGLQEPRDRAPLQSRMSLAAAHLGLPLPVGGSTSDPIVVAAHAVQSLGRGKLPRSTYDAAWYRVANHADQVDIALAAVAVALQGNEQDEAGRWVERATDAMLNGALHALRPYVLLARARVVRATDHGAALSLITEGERIAYTKGHAALQAAMRIEMAHLQREALDLDDVRASLTVARDLYAALGDGPASAACAAGLLNDTPPPPPSPIRRLGLATAF